MSKKRKCKKTYSTDKRKENLMPLKSSKKELNTRCNQNFLSYNQNTYRTLSDKFNISKKFLLHKNKLQNLLIIIFFSNIPLCIQLSLLAPAPDQDLLYNFFNIIYYIVSFCANFLQLYLVYKKRQ